MTVKEFVKKNPIDVNETNDWIELIIKFIDEFEINAKVYESGEGYAIDLFDDEVREKIEEMLYYVEEEETSLEYIFEGRVFSDKDGE